MIARSSPPLKGWRGRELKIGGVDVEPQMLRHTRRSPNMSLHTHTCVSRQVLLPTEAKTVRRSRDPSFWMEGSASRRVRRIRQFRAVRRRGRILLPAWRSPHPNCAGSPLRPPNSRVRRQRRSPRTRGPLLLSPVSSKSTRPVTGLSSIRTGAPRTGPHGISHQRRWPLTELA